MMKKYLKGITSIILIGSLLVGCGSLDSETIHTGSKGADKDHAKALTISTYFPSAYLEVAAKAFEKQYPDVTVEVNSFKDYVAPKQVGEGQEAPGEDTNPNHTLKNYITYLNTSFMSGNTDDMILLSWLPINKYVESGYLLDLGELIETDSDLTDEDYYLNVLKGNTYNDIIYSIPMCFSFDMAGINNGALKKSNLEKCVFQADYWNFEEMNQLFQAIPEGESNELYLQVGTSLSLFLDRFDLESSQFVNLETKALNFDSEEFIQLLELCKEVGDKGLLYEGEYEEEYALFLTNMSDGRMFYQDQYMGEKAPYNYMKPVVNKNGEIAIRLGKEIAITKDSKNKELCWKFIKFMLSEELQKSPELHGNVVNKEAQGIKIEQKIKEIEGEYKEEKIKFQVSKEDLNKNINKWTKMPFIQYTTDEINDAVIAEVELFFKGQKSAKYVAASLQNKLHVMLNE